MSTTVLVVSTDNPKLYTDQGDAIQDAVMHSGNGLKLYVANGINMRRGKQSPEHGWVVQVETEAGDSLGCLVQVVTATGGSHEALQS